MACIKKYYTKDGQESKLFNELRDRFGENRAEEIYLKVHTPAFKTWFGDWENNKGSQGIDENGEPQIYWHGTNQSRIESFIQDRNYFSSDIESSQLYAQEQVDSNGGRKEMYPVFLRITDEDLDSKDVKVLADQVSVSKAAASNIKSLFNDGGFSSMTDNIYQQKLAPEEIATNLLGSATAIKEPSGKYYNVAGQQTERVSTVVDSKKPLKYHGDEKGEQYADKGTRYHKMTESLIKLIGTNGVSDGALLQVKEQMGVLPFEEGYLRSMQTFINGLHRRGGRILSEVRVAKMDGNGGKGVAGTLDIIHIRTDGFADIYDIKTAHETPYKILESEKHGISKDPWDISDYDWYKAKRYSHQLALYGEMLQSPDNITGRSSVTVNNIYVVPVEVFYTNDGKVKDVISRKVENIKNWTQGKKKFYTEAKRWSEAVIKGKKENQSLSGITTASTVDEFLPKALNFQISGPDIDQSALKFVEAYWSQKKFKLDDQTWRDWISEDKEARVNQIKELMNDQGVKRNAMITQAIETYFYTGQSRLFDKEGDSGSSSARLAKILDTARAVDVIQLSTMQGFEEYDDLVLIERADGTYDILKMTWENLEYRLPIAFKETNVIRKGLDEHGELATNSILGNHIRPEVARALKVKLQNTVGDYYRMRMGLVGMELQVANPDMKINRIIVDDLHMDTSSTAALAIPAATVMEDIKKMYELPTIKPLATGSLKQLLDNSQSYSISNFQANPLDDLADYMATQLDDKAFVKNDKPNARAKIRAIVTQFKNHETSKENLVYELMNGVVGLRALLRDKYSTDKNAEERIASDPEFMLLANAIATLQGITITPEIDISKEFFGFISMWLKTPAATGRQTADKTFDLLRQFQDNIKRKIIALNEEKKPYVNQLIRESPLIKRGLAMGDVNVGGTDVIFAMGQSVFDDLFQTTTNKEGVTVKRPVLKADGSAEFNKLNNSEKEFIRYFNKTMKKYNPKWPVGLVPLMKASSNTLLYRTKSEALSGNIRESASLAHKTIKRSWETASHRGKNIINEEMIGDKFTEQFNQQIIDGGTEFRSTSLQKYGFDSDYNLIDYDKSQLFETNLEQVLTSFGTHYIKKEEYDRALPVYYVMRSILKTYELAYGFDQTDTIKMLDTYVADIVANIKMAEDKTVTALATAGVNTASIALLGLNTTVYINNAVQMWSQGMVDSITNTMTRDPRFPGIADFGKAGAMMLKVMNPAGDAELGHRLRLIKDMYLPDDIAILTGKRNQKTASGMINTQLAFALDRSTEYTIRTQHLIAQMLKDGSFEAHRAEQVKDADGFYRWKLVYDPKKDKRFQGDEGKMLYDRLKESMGEKNELNDKGELKLAYDWRLRARLTAYINQQIGSFDKDVSSHVSHFAIAYPFTQFRTWFRDRYVRATKLEYQSDVFGDYVRNGDKLVWEKDTMKGILWTLADAYTIGKKLIKDGTIEKADKRNLIFAANSVSALMLVYVLMTMAWEDDDDVPPIIASTFTRYQGDMLSFLTLDPYTSALSSPVVFVSYYQRLFRGIAKAMSYGVEGEEQKMMEAFERVLPKVYTQFITEE
jgi:hypothetical protein